MRFDASMESLINIGRSESFADLKNTDMGGMSRSFSGSSTSKEVFLGAQGKEFFDPNQQQLLINKLQ